MVYREIDFTAVKEIKIGHSSDFEGITGCTVILPQGSCRAGIDIRGGGPAGRETQLLDPLAMAREIHAVVLSGGSAFGLRVADGVMQYLEERKTGFDVGVTVVPLVPASCLFDLSVGDYRRRPDAAMGYEACCNASHDVKFGSVGAGTGCTIGKIEGLDRAMKSGIGGVVLQAGEIYVAAVVAVNAFGDIYEKGREIAGLRKAENSRELLSTEELLIQEIGLQRGFPALQEGTNTTIGAIITNAKFEKAQLSKIAGMGHQGMSRAIRPVHTMYDGDSLYALSVGELEADLNAVGTLAAVAVEKAIVKAVKEAESLAGLPSYAELN